MSIVDPRRLPPSRPSRRWRATHRARYRRYYPAQYWQDRRDRRARRAALWQAVQAPLITLAAMLGRAWRWLVGAPGRVRTWWNDPDFTWTPRACANAAGPPRHTWHSPTWDIEGWRHEKQWHDWLAQFGYVVLFCLIGAPSFADGMWFVGVILALLSCAGIAWTEVKARWENRTAVAAIQVALVAFWGTMEVRQRQYRAEQRQHYAGLDEQIQSGLDQTGMGQGAPSWQQYTPGQQTGFGPDRPPFYPR